MRNAPVEVYGALPLSLSEEFGLQRQDRLAAKEEENRLCPLRLFDARKVLGYAGKIPGQQPAPELLFGFAFFLVQCAVVEGPTIKQFSMKIVSCESKKS